MVMWSWPWWQNLLHPWVVQIWIKGVNVTVRGEILWQISPPHSILSLAINLQICRTITFCSFAWPWYLFIYLISVIFSRLFSAHDFLLAPPNGNWFENNDWLVDEEEPQKTSCKTRDWSHIRTCTWQLTVTDNQWTHIPRQKLATEIYKRTMYTHQRGCRIILSCSSKLADWQIDKVENWQIVYFTKKFTQMRHCTRFPLFWF